MRSNFRALRKRDGVVDIDAEVANGILDVRMTQQHLHGAKVAGCLVDMESISLTEFCMNVRVAEIQIRPLQAGFEISLLAWSNPQRCYLFTTAVTSLSMPLTRTSNSTLSPTAVWPVTAGPALKAIFIAGQPSSGIGP